MLTQCYTIVSNKLTSRLDGTHAYNRDETRGDCGAQRSRARPTPSVDGLVVIVAFFDQFVWMAYGRLLHVQAADLELLFSRVGAALDLSSMEVDRLADNGDTIRSHPADNRRWYE
jgi:hypothetical protein